MSASQIALRRTGHWGTVILCASALGLLTAVAVWNLSDRLSDDLLLPRFQDAYFGSDIPRQFTDMTSADVPYKFGGSPRHPLVRLVFLPVVSAMRGLLGVSAVHAVRALLSMNALVWAVLLFLICVRVTLRCFDSLVLTLLGLTSAAAIFWLTVPETFPFGSTTMLLVLYVISCTNLGRLRSANLLAHVVSLSMTTTNWMAGIVVTLLRLGWRKALSVGAGALALTALLFVLQAFVLPRTAPLANPTVLFDRTRLAQNTATESSSLNTLPLHVKLQHFFLTPSSPSRIDYRVIPKGDPWPPADLPSLGVLPRSIPPRQTIYPPLFSGPWKVIPWIAWLAVVVAGVVATVKRWSDGSVLLRATVVVLAGQFALHMVYGPELFIYCLHWSPLLVVPIAPAVTHRLRVPLLATLCFLIVHNATVNLDMFIRVAALTSQFSVLGP